MPESQWELMKWHQDFRCPFTDESPHSVIWTPNEVEETIAYVVRSKHADNNARLLTNAKQMYDFITTFQTSTLPISSLRDQAAKILNQVNPTNLLYYCTGDCPRRFVEVESATLRCQICDSQLVPVQRKPE